MFSEILLSGFFPLVNGRVQVLGCDGPFSLSVWFPRDKLSENST